MDKRLFHAKNIMEEFESKPLSLMPKLREDYLRGKVYGACLTVEWEDDTSGRVIVFDPWMNAYSMVEKEYINYANSLAENEWICVLLDKDNSFEV